jgi:hypothetical protein
MKTLRSLEEKVETLKSLVEKAVGTNAANIVKDYFPNKKDEAIQAENGNEPESSYEPGKTEKHCAGNIAPVETEPKCEIPKPPPDKLAEIAPSKEYSPPRKGTVEPKSQSEKSKIRKGDLVKVSPLAGMQPTKAYGKDVYNPEKIIYATFKKYVDENIAHISLDFRDKAGGQEKNQYVIISSMEFHAR